MSRGIAHNDGLGNVGVAVATCVARCSGPILVLVGDVPIAAWRAPIFDPFSEKEPPRCRNGT